MSWDLLVSSLTQPEKLILGIIYFDTLTYEVQSNYAEELLQLEKDQFHGLSLVIDTWFLTWGYSIADLAFLQTVPLCFLCNFGSIQKNLGIYGIYNEGIYANFQLAVGAHSPI